MPLRPLVNSVTSISPSNEVKLAVYSGSSRYTNKTSFIPLFFMFQDRLGLDSEDVVTMFVPAELIFQIPRH